MPACTSNGKRRASESKAGAAGKAIARQWVEGATAAPHAASARAPGKR